MLGTTIARKRVLIEFLARLNGYFANRMSGDYNCLCRLNYTAKSLGASSAAANIGSKAAGLVKSDALKREIEDHSLRVNSIGGDEHLSLQAVDDVDLCDYLLELHSTVHLTREVKG